MKAIKIAGAVLLSSAWAMLAQTPPYIWYVDATTNNVTLADGSPLIEGTHYAVGQTYQSNEGLWDYRTGYGNGSSIWQNAPYGQVDINAPILRIPLSLQSPGEYTIYAYFWSDTSGWRVRAGLSLENLTLYSHVAPLQDGLVQLYPNGSGGENDHPDMGTQYYSQINGVPVLNTPSAQGLMVSEGNRRLLQATLGTITVTEPTTVYVYFGPDLNQQDSNQRTWMDGAGYLYVPEPSALALLALAGVFGLGVRRAYRR